MSWRTRTILKMVPENDIRDPPLEPVKNDSLEAALYARPYHMTGPVFSKFCETQTTYDSWHLYGLADNLKKLNNAFPKLPENRKVNRILPPQESSSLVGQQLDSFFPPENLICNEKMPSENSKPQNFTPASPVPTTSYNQILEFDSDDSVLDKDYCPSLGESSDSDTSTASGDFTKPVLKAKKVMQTVIAAHQSEKPSSTEPTPTQQCPRRFLKSKNIKRRNTVDTSKSRRTGILEGSKRRHSTCGFRNKDEQNCQTQALDNLIDVEAPQKKRKKYEISLAQRKIHAKQQKRMEYEVKPGCKEKCFKQCMKNISQEDREHINKQFWNLTWQQRLAFVAAHTSVAIPKRKTTRPPQRKSKRKFMLKKQDGIVVEVCKLFFLSTLGYKKGNDRILYNSFPEDHTDKRGQHQKTPAYDRDLLTHHVESFNPAEPHYRREHAPLRRYIPSDVNIAAMHKDFNEKNQSVSYEVYRKHVKKMNISFTRLGNEECEICECYNLHKLQASHDALSQVNADCNDCVQWARHHEKYRKARELYDSHKKIPRDGLQIFVSSDLEKVIMLPRMESFKSVIFCQRLIAFNQTFAPIGKITNEFKPVTVIWHDAIAGRKQEDIMSAFYYFMISNRDIKNVNIWLDNCSDQNKNWLLYSLLLYMVNSDLIATENLTLYYFEPGHTFMSCDQVHHQVELAMKKKGKIYDFADFEEAVSSINNSKVVVKGLQPENLLNIPNLVSDRRIQNSNPRAYLKNMAQVCFKRNNFDMLYKNNFDEEYTSLRFMNDKFLKNPTTMTITFRSLPKGVEPEKKEALLRKLSSIIPPHKLTFWQNLPVSNKEQTSNPRSRKTS